MEIIDVHTHGIGGYDTRTADPGEILRMAEIQGSFGASAIVPTLYSGSIAEMRAAMAAVKAAMEAEKSERRPGTDRRSAAILGAHLEGPFLNPLRHGALDPGNFLEPRDYHLRSLIDGFDDIIRIITISPELDGAPALIRQCADLGIKVSMGHSGATFAEAETAFQHGATGITHLMNAMAPFHQREPGIAGFGLLNPHVYVEVIADPFHLHPKSLELVFRMKDPSRIIIISDSVKETHPGEGWKKRGPVEDASGTLQGGSMTIIEAAGRLMEIGLDGDTVMGAISANPAAYLKR